MKNKSGKVTFQTILLTVLTIAVVGGIIGFFAIYSNVQNIQQTLPSSTTTKEVVNQITSGTKDGKVSNLGVYVYDLENNNKNTKVAVPVYCQDEKGNFVLDGIASSTTTLITGSTEIGRTITCWAFNATYQSNPTLITITGESPIVNINAFRTLGAGYGHLQFYTDTLVTGTGGIVNVTAEGSSGSGTLNKLRFTINQSNNAYWLGGFYFDKIVGSNVSTIEIGEIASLQGNLGHASTTIVPSKLGTSVSSRTEQWNVIFEIDDNSAKEGNQPLLMHQNDYIESGSVKVIANGLGCNNVAGTTDLISSYAFQKGYFRSAVTNGGVKFGSETDATAPAVIGSGDVTGDTFYCK